MRRILVVVAFLACGLTYVQPAHAQGQICFEQKFDGDNAPYNFPFAHTPGTQWSRERLPAGGWNGSGGEHVIFHAGQRQYDYGYSAGRGSCTFPDGSTVYIRLRVKWDESYRWNGGGSMQDKMIIWGDNDSNSRFMLMNEKPNASRPCTAPDSIGPTRGFISLMKNIGGDPGRANIDCTPYYIVEAGVWYHLQLAVDTAADCLKLWVNSNNEAVPTRSYCGGKGGGNYSAGADWNEWKLGFMSDAPKVTAGKIVDDFVIAKGFDPKWFPGASVPGARPQRRIDPRH